MATVQRPHDADARQHRWPVMFGDQQPRLHAGRVRGGCLQMPVSMTALDCHTL